MQKNEKGSSLLMVICFTGAVSLMALGVWRNAMYNLESVLDRTSYMRALKTTEGLLNLAIEVGIENYDNLIERNQETLLEIPNWFSQRNDEYLGVISFNAHKEWLVVGARLKNNDRTHCSLRCHISKHSDGGYSIWAWAIDRQS